MLVTSNRAVKRLVDDAMADGLEDYGLTMHELLRFRRRALSIMRALLRDEALGGDTETFAMRKAQKILDEHRGKT